MNEFLAFRRYITPAFIQVVFWLGTLGILIAAVIEFTSDFGSDLMGLLLLVLGPILWRVYCELIVLQFRMNENILHIRRSTALLAGEEPPPLEPPAAFTWATRPPTGFPTPSEPVPGPPAPAGAQPATTRSPTWAAPHVPDPPPAPSAITSPRAARSEPVEPESRSASETPAPQTADSDPQLRFCTQCGSRNATENRFCESCGVPLRS